MGYLSHRVHPDQIKAGDHIYTWRAAFTYSHHGIYVGGNMVIHFTAPDSGWNLFSSTPSSCLNSVANSCSGWNLCSSTPSSCLNSVANSGSGWNLSSSTPSSCLNSVANSGSGWNLSSSTLSSCLNSIDSGLSQPKDVQNCDSGSCLNSNYSGLSQPKDGQNCDSGSCLNSNYSGLSQPKDGQNCDSGSCLNSNYSGLSQPKSGQDYVSGECLSTHNCGFKQSNSGVMVSCLNCFIGTGSLYLYKYGVNKIEYDTKLRGGTCTIQASDPPEDVISRAIHLLHNGFGDYSVFKNNCEDFALYCKTGLLISGNPTTGGSGQVNYFFNAPWKTMASSSAIMALTSAVVGAALFAVAVPVRTVFKRHTKDIGVRDDVVKVKVEDVGSFRGF